MSKEGTTVRKNSLQALRFVFVMLIFMSHFNYHVTTSFDAGGDCGVAFFFILSGFVMSMGYGRCISDGTFHFKRFIARRLKKIYPLHLLCLAVFVIIFRPAIDHRLPLNALLLQSYIPDDSYYFSYNGVSWFLSSLLLCYLLFPLAYRYASRHMLMAILVYYAVIYIIVPYTQINALLYVCPPVRFVDFFIGIMLFKFYDKRQDHAIPRWVEPLLVILLAVALAIYPDVDAKFRNAPLYWLILLPLIYVFTKNDGPVSRALHWPFMQWLGALSMPIFLIHPIVFRSMFHFFPSIAYPVMLTLCFAVTVMLSWVADRYFLRRLN